ncbi:MAG: M1 family metallopeptidase, partial [Bacteroidota bacterium]|nr:M1 family metallopeptidase [Bacteroidota bacterium]
MRNILRSILMSGLLCSPFVLFSQEYFQQRVDHVIDVRLDDHAHFLHASQQFTYTNNSPVALDSIWMHLWPNAYSKPNTALDKQMLRTGDVKLHFAKEEDRGRIDSLDFKMDGNSLVWGYHEEHPDIAWIKLQAPLPPGSSITITTPFRVKIPHSRYSRLGHTGQAYHITQWYPKPAVYDADGWHAMPYLTMGEFYSEFGTFDVSITLPENYVVGSTGILQENTAETAFMEARSQAAVNSTSNEFPPSAPQTKTIRYVQENVHDHAWFADKRFIVRKDVITLPKSGRTVTAWAMFTPKNAELWSDAVTYVKESVRLYSEWVGDYPYDACTVVDGTISAGGGMEYPMITIIGEMGDKEALDNVIAHEVGHNWFYGILGSNERDYAWMDEGMNSFVELRYMRERYPAGSLTIDVPLLRGLIKDILDPHRFQSEGIYALNARRNLDQPSQLHSSLFTMVNYAGMVYSKTALIFDHLFAYLGPEVFDRCMHSYYDKWKFKHPSPANVRAVFEQESGKDLSWVFDLAIGSDEKLDLKALRLKGDQLRYRNSSSVAVPFPITGWRDTTLLGTTWSDGAVGESSVQLPWNDATIICIDHQQRTLDIDRRNDQVSAKGLFRRTAMPHFGFLTGLEKHDRKSLYWTPLIGRNGHDGWHFGIGLHNYHFPSQRTE